MIERSDSDSGPTLSLDAPSGESPLRILISTGEVSGDLQGALLIEALKRNADQAGLALDIVGLGGDRMLKAGATLLAQTSAISSVGLIESLPYVLPTLTLQRRVQRMLKAHPPDLVVLIDYLGPNLGMGRFLRKQFPALPILYYIAPQEWVWSVGQQNTAQIVTMVDHLLAIFPEEARYYASHGAKVTFVGHPLLDRMKGAPSRQEARQMLGIGPNQTAIALFPASRRQELHLLMPTILDAAQRIQAQLPTAHFWIPLSLDAYRPALEQALGDRQLRATIVEGDARPVLAAADLAIAKSGTVNLEAAILGVPQIAAYRVNPITAWVARKMLKFSIPFMSPPNLVRMEPVVPEFLQEEATPEALATAALELLTEPAKRQAMLDGYARMRAALGEPGVCDRAAQWILAYLTQANAHPLEMTPSPAATHHPASVPPSGH